MAELEQDLRHGVQRRGQWHEFARVTYAFLLALGMLLIAALLVVNGKGTEAAAVVGVQFTVMVTAFLFDRHQKQKGRSDTRQAQSSS